MVHAVIYSLRGWIAFVAFINIATAIRCYTDVGAYVSRGLAIDSKYIPPTEAVGRVLGLFHVLVAVVLTHSAFRIEHYSMISVALCTLLIIIFYFVSETFVYRTVSVGFSSLFPILISVFTIIWILFAPKYLGRGSSEEEKDTEDMMMMLATRRKRWNKKRI